MTDRTCLIGFDAPEADALTRRLPGQCLSFEMPPRVLVRDGRLFVEAPEGTSSARLV
jgi:hypothetical protein